MYCKGNVKCVYVLVKWVECLNLVIIKCMDL